MGAWEFMRDELRQLLPKGCPLTYVGRERSAATAVGSHALHKSEQAAILAEVFKPYAVRLADEIQFKS